MMSDIHQEIQELAALGLSIGEIVSAMNHLPFVTEKLVAEIMDSSEDEDNENVF